MRRLIITAVAAAAILTGCEKKYCHCEYRTKYSDYTNTCRIPDKMTRSECMGMAGTIDLSGDKYTDCFWGDTYDDEKWDAAAAAEAAADTAKPKDLIEWLNTPVKDLDL